MTLLFRASLPSWYPASYYIQPHYSTMPAFLLIEDAVRPNLSGRRRRFWTRARDAGLAQWNDVGFAITVLDTTTPYGANRVTLNFDDKVPPELGAWHWFEGPPCGIGTGCDWIHFNPTRFEQAYLAHAPGQVKYLVAHEFGHSLGFGHGGTGIMDETPDHAQVNDEEIAAARAYWFP